MKAMMYLEGKDSPVAVLDEIKIIEMNDNHRESPVRITFLSKQLSASKVMTELFRDAKMLLKLDDGRECTVLLQHSSLDLEGRAVGVLRVLGEIADPVGA